MSDDRQTKADINIYPWATPADPSNVRVAMEKGEMDQALRMATLKGKLVEAMKNAGIQDSQILDYGVGISISSPTQRALEAASNLTFVEKPKVYKI